MFSLQNQPFRDLPPRILWIKVECRDQRRVFGRFEKWFIPDGIWAYGGMATEIESQGTRTDVSLKEGEGVAGKDLSLQIL